MGRFLIKGMFVGVVIWASSLAFAQVSTPAQGVNPNQELFRYRVMQVYEDLVEKRSREILSRYLPTDQFSVNVAVEVKNQAPTDIPYLPGGGAIFPENINSPVYHDLIQKVSIELLFAKKVDAASRTQLVTVVKKGLKLEEPRGDAIKVGDFDVSFVKPNEEFERRIEDIERKLRMTEDDLRRSQRDADILAKEKSDLQNKLQEQLQKPTTPSELDKKLAEEKDKEKEKEKSDAELPKKPDLQFWISKGLIGVLGLLTLIILFLVSRSLAAAISGIGKGIGGLGAAIQGMGSGGTKGSETKVEINQTGQQGGAQAPASGAAPSIDIETTRRRLAELQVELKEKITDNTMPIILGFLNRALRQEASVARGVAAMELLGADIANGFYQKLGDDARSAITKFLQGTGYGNNKYDIMLEAGENLKTSLMEEGLGDKQNAKNNKVLEYLMRLGDTEIETIAATMDSDTLARFLLYFDPTRTAWLLGAVCARNPQIRQEAADVMLKLPGAETRSELDDQILAQISAWESKERENTYGPYLKLYTDIVSSLGEELTENILARLEQANETVSQYLRSKIITFSYFFKLPKTMMEEIINGLGNKDTAALIVGSQGKEKETINSVVADRRREMVTEEVEAMNNLDGRKLKPRVQEARAKVVQVMEQMKKDGRLVMESEGAATDETGGMVAA